MAGKDYYEVLGVDRGADAKTIKRAFLKRARKLHPDVSNDPDAEERFKEVNEAYSVLSDERKRANYDRFGTAEGPGGFGSDYVDMSDIFGGGFGINDIFDSFFGGPAGRSSARQASTRGRDMGLTLHITLEEAAAGCKKSIAYERLAPCDDCGGTGVAEGGHEKECGRCHGMGVVREVQRTIFGQMQSQSVCPDCGGSGKVIDKPCETCDGQGRAPSRETVDIEIPAGIHSGQSLSVSGRGEAGVRGSTRTAAATTATTPSPVASNVSRTMAVLRLSSGRAMTSSVASPSTHSRRSSASPSRWTASWRARGSRSRFRRSASLASRCASAAGACRGWACAHAAT